MKTLLLDIETAPHRVYSWGLWKQDIHISQIEEPGYTLCWAAKWYGNPDIKFRSVLDGKTGMLQEMHSLLDEADAVIHYNGSKFDLPILNQEFLIERFDPPSPTLQIDLLNTVRKRFRFPSNKLDYILRILSLEGKLQHKGMELWKECMDGDREAWKIMKEYNINDVIRLEEAYEILKPWVSNHPNHALFSDDNAPVCPNCGSRHLHKRGTYFTKTLTYQRYHCQSCGAWSRERTTNLDKEKRPSVMVGVS